VLGLYRDRYFDLSVRHFHEKLAEEHELEISYSWVKQALQRAGLVARGRKGACEDCRMREDLDKGTLRGRFVIAYRRAGVIQWPNSIHRFGRRDAIEDTSALNRRQPGLRESRYRANAGMLRAYRAKGADVPAQKTRSWARLAISSSIRYERSTCETESRWYSRSLFI
jgi:hypothetical protein